MKEPLAQRLRPRTLDEVLRPAPSPGPRPDGVPATTIDRGVIPNMIFTARPA